MKRKIKLAFCSIVIAALSACMYGCVEGDVQKEIEEGTVKYEMLLNTGSCFVYTFQDPETGVWYLATSEGITERVNQDGSLYQNK